MHNILGSCETWKSPQLEPRPPTASAVEEFSQAIFTLYGEARCYGVAHWHRCYASALVRGVAGYVTSSTTDPLQSDSFARSSPALYSVMIIHAHTHTHKQTHLGFEH